LERANVAKEMNKLKAELENKQQHIEKLDKKNLEESNDIKYIIKELNHCKFENEKLRK
jgi:hypothetical protein